MHLLGGVGDLGGDVFVVFLEGPEVVVDFEALVLEVVPFLGDGVELGGDGVGDELVLDGLLELVEELDQVHHLALVGFDEVLLVLEDGLLAAPVHGGGGFLDVEEQLFDLALGLLHHVPRTAPVLPASFHRK